MGLVYSPPLDGLFFMVSQCWYKYTDIPWNPMGSWVSFSSIREFEVLGVFSPKTLFHIALRRPVAYLFATPPRVGSSPALGYDVNSLDGGFSEYSNMPLEHTKTTPQPTIYEGIPFIWEFSGYAPLGMLGFFLEEGLSCGVWVVLFFLRKLSELQESFY